MEQEVLDKENEELAKVQKEIAIRKEKQSRELILPEKDTDVMTVVKQEENELLKTEEIIKIGKKFGEERIKSDLSAEASRIRRKNIETAENEFENETRELRLKHLKSEMELEHKYNMSTLEKDSKHKQMLAYRRKLVEEFGYLYNCSEENMITCYDHNGEPYKVPKDFSYSKFVNKVRQFGRNVSKLDRPILQFMKWTLIGGAVIGGIFILKSIGVIA